MIIWKTPHSLLFVCWGGERRTLSRKEEICLFVPEADAEILDDDGDVLHSGYLVHKAWNSYSVRFVYIFIISSAVLIKQAIIIYMVLLLKGVTSCLQTITACLILSRYFILKFSCVCQCLLSLLRLFSCWYHELYGTVRSGSFHFIFKNLQGLIDKYFRFYWIIVFIMES